MLDISAPILGGKKLHAKGLHNSQSMLLIQHEDSDLNVLWEFYRYFFPSPTGKKNKKPAFTCRATYSVSTPAWFEIHTAILGSGHVLIYQFLSLHNWCFTLYHLLILSGLLHRYLRQLNHGAGDLIMFTWYLLWHYLLNSLSHNKDFSSNCRAKFQSEQWNLGLFVFSSLKLLKHLNSIGNLLILLQEYLLSSA